MYKVFFVDDEIVVREGIRNSIDWEKTNFILSGEAPDGEMALSLIQDIKPDILITDIKMPFIDGLELARIIRKMQPWTHIIILSGHDEFDYAKQAISIGVAEYILKPFSSEDLLRSLEKVAKNIEEERKLQTDVAMLRSQLESNAVLIKERWLSDLVLGSVAPADSIKKAADLDIDLIAKWYLTMVIEVSVMLEQYEELLPLKQLLRTLFEHEKKPADNGSIFFVSAPGKFVVILKHVSAEAIEDAAYAAADAVKYEVQRAFKFSVAIGIGSAVERIALIPKSFLDAQRVLRMTAHAGKNKIFGIDDLQGTDGTDLLLFENDPVIDDIKYASISEITRITEQYVKLLGDNPLQLSIVGSYLLVDVIMAASRIVEELGGNVKELFPEMLTHEFIIRAIESLDNFAQSVTILLEKILGFRDSHISSKYGNMILKAKRYIDDNYRSQDISLLSVASEVHISPNHFSAVFSQECGISFIEYLTSVRLDNAKKLLTATTMKSADIAYETGFSDPHYFSFIFKKNVGMTPREYRESVKK